jgi:hypothetical protein
MEKERLNTEITKLFVRVILRNPTHYRSYHNLFKGPEVGCNENAQNVIKAIFYFETAFLKYDCGNCAGILTFLSKDSY